MSIVFFTILKAGGLKHEVSLSTRASRLEVLQLQHLTSYGHPIVVFLNYGNVN